MRFIVPFVVVLLVVAGVAAIVYAYRGVAPTVTQPLAFNHVLHLETAGLTCSDCHTDAATHVHAGLPGKDICLDCHDIDEEIEPDSELAKLVPYADNDENLPWKRVALTAPDVFFSHRRHVSAGQIDCLRCHDDQPTLSAPPRSARLVMTMDDCIACHEEQGASTDCLACHR